MNSEYNSTCTCLFHSRLFTDGVVVRLPCLAAAAGTEADSLIAGEAGVCTEPYMEVSELVDVRA